MSKRKSKKDVVSEESSDDIIDFSTSSEEDLEEVGVAKSQVIYFSKKNGKKWEPCYCLIIGSSFYWYKDTSSSIPKGSAEISNAVTTFERIEFPKRPNCFVLKEDDEAIFYGSTDSAADLDDWIGLFETSRDLTPIDPPDRSISKRKKGSALKRAKKRAASKTATSGIGKKVMRVIVNEETTALLTALKKIVRKDSGSNRKAEELERNIIKIAVKAFILIDDKKISADAFLVADGPIRSAFELLIKCFNGRNRVRQDVLVDALARAVDFLKESEEIIAGLLESHLTPKNVLRLSSAFSVLADTAFLERVFTDEELENELEQLIDAMEYYTQFHY
eukprot:TRINITY_DN2184_c0_g1_i1.p1 TRINITY_DN2184_c0_g1~~TRINITY_DN2184_c0_g1_i1.p1  ORF type:complete len:334 (+),score=90.03 TRINITY_DN2184_c0_g1_i1:378-1379(+)